MGSFPSTSSSVSSSCQSCATDSLSGSIHYTPASLRESGNVRKIDAFVQLTLKRAGTYDSIKAVVDNPIALKTFAQFLAHNLSDIPKTVIDNITDRSTVCQSLVDQLEKSFIQDPVLEDRTDYVIDFAIQKFPEYLFSNFFDDWRTREVYKAITSLDENMLIECTLPELETVDPSMESRSEHSTSAKYSSKQGSIITSGVRVEADFTEENENFRISSIEVKAKELHGRSISTLFMQPSSSNLAIHSCDPIEVAKIIKIGGWLPSFITAVETLPIGITLSSVSRQRPGYPVVYLNKHFEDNCGHKREDIVGEIFGFMQKP
eukprot:gene11529-24117_t